MIFSDLLGDMTMGSPFAAVVSPDGDDVYVAGISDLTHFLRDRNDGTLEFGESLPLSSASSSAIAISPNGRHVFAALRGAFNGLERYDRDAATGALSFGEQLQGIAGTATEGLDSPFVLTQTADGRFLYVLNGEFFNTPSLSNALSVVSTNPGTGAMSLVQTIPLPEALPKQLAVLTDVTVSRDGKNVYVSRGLLEALDIYSANTTTGELTYLGSNYFRGSPFGYVVSSAVSPDGKHVYVADWTQRLVYLLDRVADGSLTLRKDGPIEVDGPRSFAISSDGTRVYISSSSHMGLAAIGAYERDPSTGLLTFIEQITDGGAGFLAFSPENGAVLSPDNGNLYLPSSFSESLTVFSVKRPELPCNDFPLIRDQYDALAKAYGLYDDVDSDGLPESAALALFEEAGCANVDDALDEAITNAYLLNLASIQLESEVFETGEWEPYQQAFAALNATSVTTRVYLDQAFSLIGDGLGFTSSYISVNCTEDGCEPSDTRDAIARTDVEPFSGEGDPDGDGFTNAEEWANVFARGGSEREFAVSALDAANDGSTVVTFEGSNSSGSCFIATAAYGTPLARELDPLRELRDDRLLTNPVGSAFADAYYRLSPPLAEFISDRPVVRAIARAILEPLVHFVH